METTFLLYGSYGYSGSLIAELAVSRNMQPILAGRNLARLKSQSERLGVEYRHISLDEPESLEAALEDVPLVLNCAGPFSQTFQSVSEACFGRRKHYLDITYEISVFEALAARNTEAKQAGIMILPGVGFDVVPSDCLASHLKQRLPGATQLALAIDLSGGGSSRGTQLSIFEGISKHSVVRRNGKLVSVPLLRKSRQIDFGSGINTAWSFPWGDISTAYFSTGIPNIEVYVILPDTDLKLVRQMRPFIGLAKYPIIQQWVKQRVMKLPPGPSADERNRSHLSLWGEVRDDAGHLTVSSMVTPNGYSLTAETALRVVKRVLAGDFKPGFQTPSTAYGADFILEFEGVMRRDL